MKAPLRKKCPVCRGAGEILCTILQDEHYDEMVTCYRCGGGGIARELTEKTKLRQRSLRLSKTAKPVLLTLDRTFEEVLPMLFGMQIFWNINPCQYLNRVSESLRITLLQALRTAGYIKGGDETWTFTESSYQRAWSNLRKLIPALAFEKDVSKLPTFRIICGAYWSMQKVFRKRNRTVPRVKFIAALKKLCSKYGTVRVLQVINHLKWHPPADFMLTPEVLERLLRRKLV